MTWDEFITYDAERVIEHKPSFEELIIELAERTGRPLFTVYRKGEWPHKYIPEISHSHWRKSW